VRTKKERRAMKTPTRSPTHADVEMSRLASMASELEDLAAEHDGEPLALAAIIELAEDRGRPVSHYLAALALATELRVATPAGARITVRACTGSCQRWGALELVDHLAERHRHIALVPVSCLDRCDGAPACEVDAPDGKLVLAPATIAALDEALATLAT
jgi:NADH:ubiquinone oxidoreductase subunit E